ncbi:hypothetical protein [Yersinia mollaretii]|jgi:hypothetical protein|uniref:hypothetical protein n=1 Tax=Yersinia mollaretii TaxID=33060 RepID=UPI0025AA33A3|nr:hypothetical protein [Yersinia mollaretii]MDN0113089.1 hypothetical protein [Yersinia mollaretii]
MSEKRLASNQRRSLETMRGKLLLMAEQWDEVDYCVMSELERLADSFATVVSELTFVIEEKDVQRAENETELG